MLTVDDEDFVKGLRVFGNVIEEVKGSGRECNPHMPLLEYEGVLVLLCLSCICFVIGKRRNLSRSTVCCIIIKTLKMSGSQ